MEAGLNPAHGGLYGVVSFGLDLNLSVGGEFSPDDGGSGRGSEGGGMCTNTCRTARDGECDDDDRDDRDDREDDDDGDDDEENAARAELETLLQARPGGDAEDPRQPAEGRSALEELLRAP